WQIPQRSAKALNCGAEGNMGSKMGATEQADMIHDAHISMTQTRKFGGRSSKRRMNAHAWKRR
ncbi:MAG: hypothetical protein ACPIOQ_61585, partial [Promethearchaeia archaeon]